jgi:hypothetical protein
LCLTKQACIAAGMESHPSWLCAARFTTCQHVVRITAGITWNTWIDTMCNMSMLKLHIETYQGFVQKQELLMTRMQVQT